MTDAVEAEIRALAREVNQQIAHIREMYMEHSPPPYSARRIPRTAW
ncbi:hypothetical protein ABGB18_45385 [Nonomuraea sp. B12E4]